MKTTEKLFFEYEEEKLIAPKTETSLLIQYLDTFSSITTESFYVFDIIQKEFCYIKPDNLFLCGFTIEKALKSGYSFFSNVIYTKDLPLWDNIYKTILQHPKKNKEVKDEVDYYSCTFRLKRNCSFISYPLPHMVYHRIKHIYEKGELRYIVGSIGSSTAKDVGNLRMFSKDKLTYMEYNFTTRRWKQKIKEVLTEREKAILMLAKQGKNSKEIADYLCRGQNTIRNQIKTLFSKLKVNSMQEAIDFSFNHCMVYI